MKQQYSFNLPPEFRHDDVRYSECLVTYFLQQFTQERDVVFDPFTGFGTTLLVAEAMNRVPCGLEFDEERADYARSLLRFPERLITGDARLLSSYSLPSFDFSMASPPYMRKHDEEDPLAAYSERGGGYDAYLSTLQRIYAQIGGLMKPRARVVIEVSNLKGEAYVTPLAWDIGRVVSQVLHFEGEIVVGWEDGYGYGYDHSYCLVFSKPRV